MRRLHAWYRRRARDLPWRRTRDPYAIWISEVMLQQTQVVTVIPYYAAWLEAFPTLEALARGDEEQVLRVWEGLGYYARARNLLRAARVVRERFDGAIPSDPDLFRSLPGVGPYIGAAVLSIAFNRDLPVVDGNVRRVLARLDALPSDPTRPPGARRIEELARLLLPPGRAALHNQALMELGALVCTPRDPGCARCPLDGACLARAAGEPARFPRRAPRRPRPHRELAVAVVRRDATVLLRRRPSSGLLGGLWELPRVEILPSTGPVRAALAAALRKQLGLEVRVGRPLPPVDHAYTHFTVTLHPFACTLLRERDRAGDAAPVRWADPATLERLAVSRADRRILARHAAEVDVDNGPS